VPDDGLPPALVVALLFTTAVKITVAPYVKFVTLAPLTESDTEVTVLVFTRSTRIDTGSDTDVLFE
jgi:hypothetical protein